MPLVEAMPARFHGPMIRYTARPLATKSSPSPPKISFTLPRVLRTPTSAAHSTPPAIPATRQAGISAIDGPGISRATNVAAMAPTTIWPSTPMFHRPAANVTTSPAAASTSGTHAMRVFPMLYLSPTAPSHMSFAARNGGWSIATNSSRTRATAATTGHAPEATRRATSARHTFIAAPSRRSDARAPHWMSPARRAP